MSTFVRGCRAALAALMTAIALWSGHTLAATAAGAAVPTSAPAAAVVAVRKLYDALARRDVGAVRSALASNVTWTEAEGFPYGGTYAGPSAVLHNVLIKLDTEWEDFSATPREFIADGNRVVALGQIRGIYKATGKRLTAPFAHVWTVADGKVVAFTQYTDTALVQKALQ